MGRATSRSADVVMAAGTVTRRLCLKEVGTTDQITAFSAAAREANLWRRQRQQTEVASVILVNEDHAFAVFHQARQQLPDRAPFHGCLLRPSVGSRGSFGVGVSGVREGGGWVCD